MNKEQILNNADNQQLNIADVNCCALQLRKVVKQLKVELKNNKHQYDYSQYLIKAITKMESAMIYAQELRQHCS